MTALPEKLRVRQQECLPQYRYNLTDLICISMVTVTMFLVRCTGWAFTRILIIIIIFTFPLLLHIV